MEGYVDSSAQVDKCNGMSGAEFGARDLVVLSGGKETEYDKTPKILFRNDAYSSRRHDTSLHV